MATNVQNPQISEPYSPLQKLASDALRRYGDFSPATVDGETILMFLEFANLVIDEVIAHPYYEEAVRLGKMEPVSYYVSPTDVRRLPDRIITSGLLYHYAAQQMSQKVSIYLPAYARTMSQALWGILHGHGPITMSVMDGGSSGTEVGNE